MAKRKKTSAKPATQPRKTRRRISAARTIPKPEPASMLAQIGVMRLTSGLMRSCAQSIADAGSERPMDLRQFITSVETRRELMSAVLAANGTPELYDPHSEYGVAIDATVMFWLADEMDRRIESLLSSMPTSLRNQV